RKGTEMPLEIKRQWSDPGGSAARATSARIGALADVDSPDALTRILIIKLGALGDFVLAFGPFAAVRAAHAAAEITLLTTQPFAVLAERAPWFDRVEIDPRAPWWNLREGFRLVRKLHGFDFVFDLQTSTRSGIYFRLAGRPPWSGVARGASHPHRDPARNRMHTVERQCEQLRVAGIRQFPAPDLRWLTDAKSRFDLPERYALLIPGAAAHRPAKRWPAERFGVLARHLTRIGLAPIVIGRHGEEALGATIRALAPETIDLMGRTTLTDLGPLAGGASLAIGNDTGPTHLAAQLRVPTLALFSAASDPQLTAPRGPAGELVSVLRVPSLVELSFERVVAALPERDRAPLQPESSA
ncbi:MAG: glycosyltransferase family 9 protein, partial [Acetobacteraceae bacterium]